MKSCLFGLPAICGKNLMGRVGKQPNPPIKPPPWDRVSVTHTS